MDRQDEFSGMLKTVVICGAAAIASVLAAQAVVSLDKRGGIAMAAVATAPEKAVAPSTSAASAQIPKAADGHFWADASVNGSHVRFLVDTGATAVALTTTDAQRLGFEPEELAYDYKVMTASGEARAARVTLDSIAVSAAKVQDVEAYVIERGLENSLLGMSYIGRLNGFEATKSALILKP